VKAELSQKDVELTERDFFQDSFSEEELRELLGDVSASEIFSWRSPSLNKLATQNPELGTRLAEKSSLTDEELIRLMVEEPRLIRRPLIKRGEELIIGTDKDAMSKAFDI